MHPSFWLRAGMAWVVLALLGLTAGALRSAVYVPLLGGVLAAGLATAKLVLVWAVLIYGFLVWQRGRYAARHLPWLGGLWLGLSVLLEGVLRGGAHTLGGAFWSTLYGWWSGPLWIVEAAALYLLPQLAGRLVRGDAQAPARSRSRNA